MRVHEQLPDRVSIRCQAVAGFPAELLDLPVARCCPKCQTTARVVMGIPEADRRYVPVRCGLCEQPYALPASSALLPAKVVNGVFVSQQIEPNGCLSTRAIALRADRPEPLRVPLEAAPTPVRELPATTHVAFGARETRKTARETRPEQPARRSAWARLTSWLWGRP